MTGKFHEHKQHLKANGKFTMQCANEGCGEMVAREGMAAYIAQYAKHKVPCQECGRKVTRECLEEHAASLCSNKRILCPLGCGTNLLQQAIVNLIMQSNVKWLSRPIKYPKVALASSSPVPILEHKCLFLLSIVFQTNNADYSKKFCMHFAM